VGGVRWWEESEGGRSQLDLLPGLFGVPKSVAVLDEEVL